MTAPSVKLAMTGANGYIGGSLISDALKRNISVLALSRKPLPQSNVSWMFFDLDATTPIELPEDIDVIVHLAAYTQSCPQNELQEVESARNLLQSALEIGARFIFVSSQTAREHAPTAYGRIKWKIEQEVIHHGGWVVRPGQVYGGATQGLYGRLIDVVDKLPIIPSFLPSPHIQPIHIDDLIKGLLTLIENENHASGVYCLGDTTSVTFSSFLKYIAKYKLRRRKYYLPIPVAVIRAVSPMLKNISGFNRLNSLLDLPTMEPKASLEALNITLRPFGFEVKRRCLLLEANALFAYILKKRTAHPVTLRHYVRAIETMRHGAPFNLPQLFLSYPSLIALLHPKDWKHTSLGNEFSWRIDAATLLAESTPEGATRFLTFPAGRKRAFLFLIKIGISELGWRLLRCIFQPLIKLSVNNENRV
jgi:nucleoside-diphosphate-sugar epimerase